MAGTGGQNQFTLARYTEEGTLDTTFNGTGEVLSSFVESARDEAYSVVIQSDGKMVVAGTSLQSPISQFALARFVINGSNLNLTPSVHPSAFSPKIVALVILLLLSLIIYFFLLLRKKINPN